MENNREEILSRLEAIKQEKKQLKKQLNDLPSLEVGKWYKDPTQFGYIYFITEIKYGKIEGYGLINGQWDDNFGLLTCSVKSDIQATDKEVETALIAEAKKRGFKEGVKFINLNGITQTALDSPYSIVNKSLQVTSPENEWMIGNSNPYIYKNGKWAEIIKPKTVHIPEGDYTETQVRDILNNRFK